jgi:hypothetical protein
MVGEWIFSQERDKFKYGTTFHRLETIPSKDHTNLIHVQVRKIQLERVAIELVQNLL